LKRHRESAVSRCKSRPPDQFGKGEKKKETGKHLSADVVRKSERRWTLKKPSSGITPKRSEREKHRGDKIRAVEGKESISKKGEKEGGCVDPIREKREERGKMLERRLKRDCRELKKKARAQPRISEKPTDLPMMQRKGRSRCQRGENPEEKKSGSQEEVKTRIKKKEPPWLLMTSETQGR